jgi:hypothetical protein
MIILVCFGRTLGALAEDGPIPFATEELDAAQEQISTLRFSVETVQGDVPIELHLPASSKLVVVLKAIITEELPRLVAYFGWAPTSGIHLHYDTAQTQANGYARVFPHNLVGLFEHPPIGEEALTIHAQYQRALIIHELIHILHMDQTRGILADIRTFFGAVGKLGGVTPRWFSEGVATWGESAFTSGGRLQSPLLTYQLKRAYLDPDFCPQIDCLDNPGVYPYGHLPYWVGAHFLAHLESQKPGVIACLVRENSRRLPFFLNASFRACTGKRAQELFAEFRQNKLLPKTAIKDDERSDRHPVYEKGAVLTKNYLVQMERDRTREWVSVYRVREPRELWASLAPRDRPLTLMPATSFSADRDELLLSGSRGFARESLRWWRLDLKTQEFTLIDLGEHRPVLLFEYESEKFVGWFFEKGRWELAQIEQGQKRNLAFLDERETKRRARLIKIQNQWQLVFASQWVNHRGEEIYTLRAIDFSRKSRLLHSSKEPFDLLDAVDDFLVVKAREGIRTLGARAHGFSPELERSLVTMNLSPIQGGFHHALVKNDLTGPLFVEEIPMISQSLTSQSLSREELEFAGSLVELSNLPTSTYPGLRHFKPKYWGFGFGGTENLTRYDVSTSLSDPLDRHTFGLMGSYYQEIKRGGGDVSYTYRPSSYGFTVGASKGYLLRGTRQSADESTRYEASFFRQFRLARLTYTPSLFAAKEEIDDFLSSRSQDLTGLSQAFVYRPLYSHSLIGTTILTTSVYHQRTDGFKAFFGERHKLMLNLRPGWDRMTLELTGAMSRLRKSSFLDGVVYGGGSAALYNLGGFHEFYGVEYGDLFGNFMRTARGVVDLRLIDHYRGPGFFPLFLKATHLRLGVDYAKTQAVFLGRDRIRRGELTSLHGGLSFKTDMAYFVPVEIDLIYAQVLNPEGRNTNQLLFLLRGSFDLSSYLN